MTGMSLLRYENGLIVERWNTSDFFGLLQQIGAAAAAERPRKGEARAATAP
jgi:hypothetical protein